MRRRKFGRGTTGAALACSVLPEAQGADLQGVVEKLEELQGRGVWPGTPYLLHRSKRVAVREIESWILADLDGFSRFTEVSRNRLPRTPEELDDPKMTLVNLVRNHGHRNVRERIVPEPRSGASEHPEYTDCLAEFVRGSWSTERARQASGSLDRALAALGTLAA